LFLIVKSIFLLKLEREFATQEEQRRRGIGFNADTNSVDVPSIDASENCTVAKSEKGKSHKIAWYTTTRVEAAYRDQSLCYHQLLIVI
jgi:hypothetical protein